MSKKYWNKISHPQQTVKNYKLASNAMGFYHTWESNSNLFQSVVSKMNPVFLAFMCYLNMQVDFWSTLAVMGSQATFHYFLVEFDGNIIVR